MKLLVSFMFLVVLANVNAFTLSKKDNRVNYDGYAVYKISLQNERQREFFENLAEQRNDFNLWHSELNEVHLMVSPKQQSFLRTLIKAAGVNFEVMIPNVQSLIDEEQSPDSLTTEDSFGWTRYNSFEEIQTWLDGILAAYPAVTEGFTIGKSYEGRDIRGIKISYKTGNPGIFIESNIHAREWITSATATWFINELLTSMDDDVRQLAENYDWYIVPVLNVDGFVYSHETDRMWRKTRQPSNESACIGADPNRNWDSHWMENGGASSNPCSETYAGTQAFSEPEVKALADYITGIKDKLNIMLAFHSYSQLLLSPYGHSAVEFPDNYSDLQQVSKAYADAVQNLIYETEYTYGSSASVLYVASGATNDWAYNEQDILISYTIEFRDKGRYGFVLPPIQIIPNCEEAMQGILALVKEAETLGYLEVKYDL